jgi:hypothetical protein
MKLFDDYLPKDGEYDMRRDTTGMPKALAKKINNHICFKGGGGGGGTVESGINKEFVPIYKEAMEDALAGYKDRKGKGATATVADMTPEQKAALAQQRDTSNQQIAGTGIYDMKQANENALKKTMGNMMGSASSGNALGSARSQAAMAGALSSQSGEQQRQRQEMVSKGIQGLGQSGTTQQKFNQQLIDAPYTEQTRLAGLLSGAPTTTTTTNSGGGGK